MHRLISLRTYKGRVSYRPTAAAAVHTYHLQQEKHNGQNNGRPSILRHSKSCNTTLACADCKGVGNDNDDDEHVCDACDMDFGEVLSLETGGTIDSDFRPRLDSWYSVGSKRSAYFSTNESLYKSVHDGESSSVNMNGDEHCPMFGPPPTIPAITAAIPEEWTVLEGDFVMVHAAYQTHLGTDCYFATSSKLNDGIIWLCVIRGGISRGQLLSFLLNLSSGTHIPEDNEYIKMISCTAFRIEPLGDQVGYLTVDGERVEYGPIQGEMFEGLVNVVVPDIE